MQCFVLLISFCLLLNMQLHIFMMLFSYTWTMNHIHLNKLYWKAFWFADIYAICCMILMRNEKTKKKKKQKKTKDKVVFFYTECLNHFTVHLINTNVLISSYWAFLIFFKFHDIWNISFLFFWFYAVVLLTLSDLTLKV